MKIKEAISKADEIRPNALSDETKARWVMELNGRYAEMMSTAAPANLWPSDITLLMPYPHDNVYVLYLCAMIDNTNEETALYANDMAVFNQADVEARQWWWRNYSQPVQPELKGV